MAPRWAHPRVSLEAVTAGTYNPTPHTFYLGANDACCESGSYPGAIYRNLWVGDTARPVTIK